MAEAEDRQARAQGLAVRSATRDMIPEISDFLIRNFPGTDHAFWARMLGMDWGFGIEEIGKALVCEDGRIVGFFGLHHSRRLIRGAEYRISAMHGVAVDRPYRGRGTSLMTEAAVSDPRAHYIAWTANPRMDARYRQLGFKEQDSGRRVLWPGSTAATLWTAPWIRNGSAEDFDAAVPGHIAKLFRDHRNTRYAEHLFFVLGKPLGLITVRGYGRRWPLSELVYASDPKLLRLAFEPIRLRIHKASRTLGFSFNPPEIGFAPLLGTSSKGSYLFKSSSLGPGDFNLLYGERMVLG